MSRLPYQEPRRKTDMDIAECLGKLDERIAALIKTVSDHVVADTTFQLSTITFHTETTTTLNSILTTLSNWKFGLNLSKRAIIGIWAIVVLLVPLYYSLK